MEDYGGSMWVKLFKPPWSSRADVRRRTRDEEVHLAATERLRHASLHAHAAKWSLRFLWRRHHKGFDQINEGFKRVESLKAILLEV